MMYQPVANEVFVSDCPNRLLNERNNINNRNVVFITIAYNVPRPCAVADFVTLICPAKIKNKCETNIEFMNDNGNCARPLLPVVFFTNYLSRSLHMSFSCPVCSIKGMESIFVT